MALSDQLTDLAAKTKQLETTAAAAEQQDRAKLENDREKLHKHMRMEATKVQSSAADAKTKTMNWWADLTARAEEQRNELHDKIEERKSERKVDKAMRNADDAES